MMKDKNTFRRRMIEKRQAMGQSMYAVANAAILKQVLQLPEFLDADTVLCYVSCRDEVRTESIIRIAIQMGKRVAVPKVEGKRKMQFYRIHSLMELTPGFHGILEPEADTDRIVTEGLMFVPGTAFDRRLYRMGYGGGYYDAWLHAHVSDRLVTCGLAYDFQLVPFVPCEPHDRPVDLLLTPTNIIRKGDVRHDN